jgi:hypothetical protein
MIFRFLSNALAFTLWHGVDAVRFQGSDHTGSIQDYAIYAMFGLILVPIIGGYFYTKVIVKRIRLQEGDGADGAPKDETFSSLVTGGRASLGSFANRILDMRSNPVVRLWWKRQSRLYGVDVENDPEAQPDSQTPNIGGVPVRPKIETRIGENKGAENVPSEEKIKKKRKKEKKEKEEEIASAENAERNEKRPKEHKHHRKQKLEGETDPLMPMGESNQEDKAKKKKSKKHKHAEEDARD